MPKKSKIVGLALNSARLPVQAAATFRVNNQPSTKDGTLLEEFPIVTNIVWCKDRYGAGAFVNEPCYAISFEGSGDVILIKKNEVVQIFLETIVEDDQAPPMPE